MDLKINDNAGRKADEFLKDYRSDSLSGLELETYDYMDSLSQAEGLERRLNMLLAIMRGYVKIGKFDLDLGKIINYNTYEGYRLGLGFETNRDFSEWLKFGAYYAYGFKDEKSKYGVNSSITILENIGLKWGLGYQNEIFESGAFDLPLLESKGLFGDNYRRFTIEKWDRSERFFSSLQASPFKGFTFQLQGLNETRNSAWNYSFANGEKEFVYNEMIASIKFSPQEKTALTPFGRLSINEGFPQFYVAYTRGVSDLIENNFTYNKLQFAYRQVLKTRAFGVASFHINSGIVFQDIPYQKNFVGTTNTASSDDFWKRAENLADRSSFQTMRFNEFLSDSYTEFMWRQDFKSLFYHRESFAPHIELVNRVAFGSLRNPQLHEGIDFKTLERGFFETGIELNKLYSSDFLALGLGFYYRYGANSFNQFQNNFGLKLTSKFVL